MNYQGGKQLISKRLAQVILDHTPENRAHLYEPFMGGGSMSAVLAPHFKTAHLSDVHERLILMWQAVYAGGQLYGNPTHFLPPTVSREDYDYHRAHKPHSPATAVIGFGSGFGGKYFGSFIGHDPRRKHQTYHDVALRGLRKKYERMTATGTKLNIQAHSYQDYEPPAGSVIYCDPPYAGTAGYSAGGFDHQVFWEWCQAQAARGCLVFVSEYSTPLDIEPIYTTQKRVTINHANNSKVVTEKLFMLGGKQ